MPVRRQYESRKGCKTRLGPIIARVAATFLVVMMPFFTHKASTQTPVSRTADQLDVRRSQLEHDLEAQRRSGKTPEDSSVQHLEDELMQVRLDEETAKQPQGPAKGPKLFLKTQILYATNRQRVGKSFSSEISNANSVEFGIANVTIGTGNGVRTDYLPNATFVSKTNATISPETTALDDFGKFRAAMQSEALSVKSPPKILLFVHGFNTSFEEALERTALIAAELQSPVVPMTYSWPSAGSVRRYSHDEEEIRASTEAFAHFLKQIVSDSPVEIVIVCHSMGAREVASALTDLAKEKFDTKKLRRVVFVAADIFTSEFQSEWPSLSSLKKIKYTFYASDGDLALKYSFYKHDAPRLGYVNSNLWSPPGASTIDASNVDSILNTFGHSYIENPQLGADIGNWITTGADPIRRGLLSRSIPDGTIYFFP
jgi:esterase/lipase superfamily enzyme